MTLSMWVGHVIPPMHLDSFFYFHTKDDLAYKSKVLSAHCFFFIHAKAALAYSRILVSQVGFNWPDEGKIK